MFYYNLRFQQKYNINYLPNWIKSMVSCNYQNRIILEHCIYDSFILQWLENANYNLRVELEDFVALQAARERGKEYNNRKKKNM